MIEWLIMAFYKYQFTMGVVIGMIGLRILQVLSKNAK